MKLHNLNLFILRHQTSIRTIFLKTCSVALALAAFYVGYCAADYLLLEEHTSALVAKAEADRQEVLDILNGKQVMVDKTGKYAKIARVEWDLVELTNGQENKIIQPLQAVRDTAGAE